MNEKGSLTLILLLGALSIAQVSANYCAYDICKTDQYCCGDNICCPYVYSTWYFWVGIVFAILLISAFFVLFRYHWRRRQIENSHLLPHYNTQLPPYGNLSPVHHGNVKIQGNSGGGYHYQMMSDDS